MQQAAELLAAGDRKACCAAVYEHPMVRWVLGGELHPGGEELTRRALELVSAGPRDRLLDVASGTGSTVLLAACEHRCEAVGVEYGAATVEQARAEARACGLSGHARFVEGDAESLPFADGKFDVVVCECSLCTFGDKRRAAAEIARVLRPGGRVALADVVCDREALADPLRSAAAAVACVAEALPLAGYEELLRGAGLQPVSSEPHDRELLETVDVVDSRLRGARVLRAAPTVELAEMLDEGIEAAALARDAIAAGTLGYAILTARLPAG